MNTQFSEADMLRLALVGDGELGLLGQILYDQGKKLKDDKERFEEAQKKQEKERQKKNIKKIHIPDAIIRKRQQGKYQSEQVKTKNNTSKKHKKRSRRET